MIAKAHVVLVYVFAWLSMVVPNCLSSENWEACTDPSWVRNAIDDIIHLSQIEPYSEEKEKVEAAQH